MSQNALYQGRSFAAPTVLRDKTGPRIGRIDHEAVARAEAALVALSSNYGGWLQEEVDKLESAREVIRTNGADRDKIDRLFARAHDLKGLAGTYGFPLVGRIAASLCRLLKMGEARLNAPLALVDAHIKAIKAAVRDNIRDAETMIGEALASELERHTGAYLDAVGQGKTG